MKVCVFGAGAVGGYLAAMLCKADAHEVSVVARGVQRQVIAEHGLQLLDGNDSSTVRPHAVTSDPGELAPQDLVFVTTKAHAQPAAARDIASLLGDAGSAVFVCNGIPWWWNYRGDSRTASPMPLLDPDAALWTHVRPERTLGCVVYSANEVVRHGVIRHTANNRWLLGEPDASPSHRLHAIQRLMTGAGLNAETPDDLRREVWIKLLRNAPLNSICTLTRLSVGDLSGEPQLFELCNDVIDEVAAIAAAHGCNVSHRVAEAKAAPRLGGAVGAGTTEKIRPSMLQDVLAGRRMELAPILGQVHAFARQAGVPSPRLDMLLSLLRGLDRAALSETPASGPRDVENVEPPP